ncbi:MAG: tRNA lysidine(34) synthetase TilS [Paludibacteraceae bacterium]|nr:tRNA lysidine(34) synthetase TilS [Paludibacteraceae bacterium]
MLRRVLKYIRDNALLQPTDRVLVCVSGGADSVALLDVLLRGGYECVVAHCNFHLRGEESNRDEQFVQQLCAEKGVKCVTKDFDTFAYARECARSIEMSARLLRYRWFDEVAQAEGCQAIAVAHHQNDQAETLIMNLRRGTGIRGLCGMRAKSKNPAAEAGIMGDYKPSDIPVIRPLLCTTHDYILHYLKDIRHIAWVEDSTNQDTAIRRNAIRQELQHYSKAEIEHIAQTAEYMQGYLELIENTTIDATFDWSRQAQEIITYEQTLRHNW